MFGEVTNARSKVAVQEMFPTRLRQIIRRSEQTDGGCGKIILT